MANTPEAVVSRWALESKSKPNLGRYFFGVEPLHVGDGGFFLRKRRGSEQVVKERHELLVLRRRVALFFPQLDL